MWILNIRATVARYVIIYVIVFCAKFIKCKISAVSHSSCAIHYINHFIGQVMNEWNSAHVYSGCSISNGIELGMDRPRMCSMVHLFSDGNLIGFITRREAQNKQQQQRGYANTIHSYRRVSEKQYLIWKSAVNFFFVQNIIEIKR